MRSPGSHYISCRSDKYHQESQVKGRLKFADEKRRDDVQEIAPKFESIVSSGREDADEDIPEIRMDDSYEKSQSSYSKPSFYKQKIGTLRETLKTIRQEIREQPKTPAALESKISTAKNMVKPRDFTSKLASSKLASPVAAAETSNVKLYRQEITKLQYCFELH